MIEEDYFLRMLKHFFDSIALLLSKKKYETGDIQVLEDMYQSAFHLNRDSFKSKSKDDILHEATENDQYEKLKLAANLFRIEAKMAGNTNEKLAYLEKSLAILSTISTNNKTYDLEMVMQAEMLKKEISNIQNSNSSPLHAS